MIDSDISAHFSEVVANTRFGDLPFEAVAAAKKSILDTVGVSLAASGLEPNLQAVIDMVREYGGTPQCSVLAFGFKAPVSMAAFANGAMAHCLDYDDQTPWGQHSSSSIVPAVLALGERYRVSGRELILAVALGQDIFTRLRCNVAWLKDWNLSTVLGVFAATAASGRLLGLSAQQMCHAFGIASLQSSGVMATVCGTGGSIRGMYAGFAAKGAVLSATMAKKGITAASNVFEGEFGILNTYFRGGYDRDAILADLGTEFRGSTTLYKQWPCVGTAHSHIHATIELARSNELTGCDVESISVFVGDYHHLMCTPLEERRIPKTLVDAKFSLPFLVAVALVRQDVSISDFTDDALRSPDILAVAQKVNPINDRSLDWKAELPIGRVEIMTSDGRIFRKEGLHVPGSKAAPLGWSRIFKKFQDCAAASRNPPASKDVHEFQETVKNLEHVEDCSVLSRKL